MEHGCSGVLDWRAAKVIGEPHIGDVLKASYRHSFRESSTPGMLEGLGSSKGSIDALDRTLDRTPEKLLALL